MKNKLLIGLMAIALSACGIIDQGNVGVQKTFGKVREEPVTPGFYTAVFSSVHEFTAKEAGIELNNLTPKAKDNLSLKDLDVTVYYKTDPNKIPALEVKYVGQSAKEGGVYYPAFNLVASIARGVIYDSVGRNYDSLSIHNKRTELEDDIMNQMQTDLDKNDPGAFKITRVVVRQVLTDPAIEESVRLKATEEAKLKAKVIQVQVAQKDVEIRNLENQGLTTNVLRNKELDVMRIAAEKGSMIIVPNGSTPMINLK